MDHERDAISEPTSITRCREILGREADDLSDADVDRIREHADAMAQVIVEMFLAQRKSQD